jgi:hypothetical protein
MRFDQLVQIVERLNLAAPASLAGAYFQEMMAILAIVFGGAFLLFAYKHYDYFAGITGFMLGGWLGLLLRNQYLTGSHMNPVIYMGAFAVVGACIAVFYRRFIGILLGGFTALCAVHVAAQDVLTAHPNQNVTFIAVFLLGGGLGALFPKFFYVLNTSLIGAVFVSYGISASVLPKLMGEMPQSTSALIHLLVFLPCLIFGVLYQLFTAHSEEGANVVVAPPPNIVIHNSRG